MNRANPTCPVLYWAPFTNRIVEVRYGERCHGEECRPCFQRRLEGAELQGVVAELLEGVRALYRSPTNLLIAPGVLGTEMCFMIGSAKDMDSSERLVALGNGYGHVKSVLCASM